MLFAHRTFLVVLLFCQIIGLALFLRGFFPIKKALQGRATHEDLPVEPSGERPRSIPSAKFGRLVILLIDALRADFVFSEQVKMPFTQEMIRNNQSFSFLAKAHPPTVTMPRIKALTTGGIPGFVDMIFNLDSKSLKEDNLINQMKLADKRILFYGDDTWMKLFPEHFVRMDGTTSFFVTDYTEVDNNVTRHIGKELSSDDWDVMILHYLGLDHIGHIAGPTSPLVGPKLKEMDNVIKRIYSAMLVWDQESEAPSLLVLCGDHGMSDTGSHGGASSTETNTPLVFMSPLFEQGKGAMLAKKQVQQIDLVPTLSLLLGLPIPQSSIGIAIPNLFQFHSLREMLRAFQLNAHQLSQAVIANGHAVDSMWELQHALKLHSDWLRTSELDQNAKNVEIMADKVAKQYILALEKMSGHMTASLSRYDLHAMVYGIAILVQTFCWVVFGLCALSSQQKTKGELGTSVTSVFLLSGIVLLVAVLHLSICSSMWIGGGDILCSANSVESFLYTVVFTLQTGVTATSLLLYFSRSKSNHISSISSILSTFSLLFQSRTHFFLVAGTLLHVLSLLSSSFVEEEHQTWYFFTSTLFIVVFSEKTLPFWTRKKRVNIKTNEERTFLSESVEDEIFSNCKSSKSLDRRKYFINEDCRQGCGMYFDENLDRLEDRNGVNAKAVTSTSGYSSSGRKQIAKTKKEVLWSCFLTVVVLGLGRLGRAWNQTGIKWADIPDIGDWLVKPENKTILSVIYFISLLFIICFRYCRQGVFTSVVFVIGVTHAYLYRTATGNLQLPWLPNEPITKGITEARLAYCCVATIVVWNLIHIYKTRNNEKEQTLKKYTREISVPIEGLASGFLLLQVLLQRPHNAAMLAVFVVQENLINEILWKSEKMAWVMIVSSLWMGHAMYFSLGNSNSLASVDISAGYVGLEDFVPSLMLILTYFSTYCGPCLWMFSGVLSVVRNTEDVSRLQKSLLQACYVIILCQVSVLCVYCTLVFSQRYHLFVWSVFSPKLLYESTKTLLCTLSVATVLCLMHFVTRVPRMDFEKTE
ncbi:GPI ethanolamine phosphate transferase 2-like isoform X1 [Acropora muricata]|uniref:GPI ethanolamine phosphate transferase 2-like isoform X1 n=2 Tax=Acropora muricata TaxID=159855 RepID=UPI0034E4F2CA